MNNDATDPIAQAHPSVAERQLRHLMVPETAACAPDKRLDIIHEPDLELLWGGQG